MVKCEWKSLTGAHYDLRPLTISPKKQTYMITDGDIPCTPEIEPSFNYEWNFCADAYPIPAACSKLHKTAGVALQWVDFGGGNSDCYVIGRYDASHDDLSYTLLDPLDSSKGVSIKYPEGEKCSSGELRSATIDVQCANVESEIMSAEEPSKCDYHLVMKSYHGCPTVRLYYPFTIYMLF